MEFPPKDIVDLVSEIASRLIERNETISISEAACGGLLSAYLVSIPGASQFFQGGTLVYSLKSRLKLSGWNEKDISNYTGPSERVALRLARNLRIELGSTYVLSETGFAGPSTVIREYSTSLDQQHDKLGTVYLGISGPSGEKAQVRETGVDDRSHNMRLFAQYGLEFILQELKAHDSISSDSDTDGKEEDAPAEKKQKTG